MENLTMKEMLYQVIDRAIDCDDKYLGISVYVGLPNNEVIINSMDNILDGKLKYYINSYNEDLELKANTEIRITGFATGKDFNSIEDKLCR